MIRLELWVTTRLQPRLVALDRWIAARWHRAVAGQVTRSLIADRARAEVDAESAITTVGGGPAIHVWPVDSGYVAIRVGDRVADLLPAEAYELATELVRAAEVADR
ncbi:hypothetical protein [Gordonia sp. NPDC003422]